MLTLKLVLDTPLFIASAQNYSDIVKLLLEKGADVNTQTNDGRIPLFIASIQNYSNIVKLLQEKGVDYGVEMIHDAIEIAREGIMRIHMMKIIKLLTNYQWILMAMMQQIYSFLML